MHSTCASMCASSGRRSRPIPGGPYVLTETGIGLLAARAGLTPASRGLRSGNREICIGTLNAEDQSLPVTRLRHGRRAGFRQEPPAARARSARGGDLTACRWKKSPPRSRNAKRSARPEPAAGWPSRIFESARHRQTVRDAGARLDKAIAFDFRSMVESRCRVPPAPCRQTCRANGSIPSPRWRAHVAIPR